jgi:hypothetical protein
VLGSAAEVTCVGHGNQIFELSECRHGIARRLLAI